MNRVKIYTSYYANHRNIPAEYQCIAVSQTRPSSVFIPTLKEAAPHWNIINMYKSGKIDFDDFSALYMYQLDVHIGHKNLRDYLLQFNNEYIVLMCYEKDYTKCHRTILLEYIEALIPELEPVGELS